MIENPLFWLCAAVAVFITGVSKGGIGGLSVLAVPLMALTISPVQAAGIMLPILIVMDGFTLSAYRKLWDKTVLLATVPFAIAGIALGAALAKYVSDDFVRVCVGVIALLFVANALFKPRPNGGRLRGHKGFGALCGAASGFTSFLAHAGGPPFKIYALPQGLTPGVFVGTNAVFFTVVNAAKILPYALLGMLSPGNLKVSLLLVPLAPLGVWTGVWLVKRMDPSVFFKIIYGLLFVVGVKLLWDGIL